MKIINIIEDVMNVAALPVLLMVLLLWIALTVRQWKSKNKTSEYHMLYMGVIILTFILYILLRFSVDIGITGKYNANIYVNISIGIGIMLVVAGGVVLHKTVGKYINESEVEEKIANLSKETKVLQEMYEPMENAKKELSYLRHDIANHIQIISSINKSIKEDKYKELKERLHLSNVSSKVEHPIIGMVLEGIIKDYLAKGVKVDADIDLRQLNNVEYEEMLIAVKLVCDITGNDATSGDTVVIRLRCKDNNEDNVKVVFRIGYKRKESNISDYRKDKLHKNENINILRYLVNDLQGDIVIDKINGTDVVTGVMEVRKVC